MSTRGGATAPARKPTARSTTVLPGRPATLQERAAGGLLGVVGGEAWQGARGGFDRDGPVTATMADLCHSYLGRDTPLATAGRHDGVPSPGWLLPVAIVHHDRRALITDTLELAIAAGVPRTALRSCVAYVELASDLLAGRPTAEAVAATTDRPAPVPCTDPPRLCGIAPIDALTAGIWALGQDGRLAELAASLAHHTEPWVAAAAAGLLGLRDGCAGVPAQWFRCVPDAEDCQRFAPALLGSRRGGPSCGSAAAA